VFSFHITEEDLIIGILIVFRAQPLIEKGFDSLGVGWLHRANGESLEFQARGRLVNIAQRKAEIRQCLHRFMDMASALQATVIA